MIREFCVAKDNDIQITLLQTNFGYHFKYISNDSKNNAVYKETIEDEQVVVTAGSNKLKTSKN